MAKNNKGKKKEKGDGQYVARDASNGVLPQAVLLHPAGQPSPEPKPIRPPRINTDVHAIQFPQAQVTAPGAHDAGGWGMPAKGASYQLERAA